MAMQVYVSPFVIPHLMEDIRILMSNLGNSLVAEERGTPPKYQVKLISGSGKVDLDELESLPVTLSGKLNVG